MVPSAKGKQTLIPLCHAAKGEVTGATDFGSAHAERNSAVQAEIKNAAGTFAYVVAEVGKASAWQTVPRLRHHLAGAGKDCRDRRRQRDREDQGDPTHQRPHHLHGHHVAGHHVMQ